MAFLPMIMVTSCALTIGIILYVWGRFTKVHDGKLENSGDPKVLTMQTGFQDKVYTDPNEPDYIAFRRDWLGETVGSYFTPAEIELLVQDVANVTRVKVAKLIRYGASKKLMRGNLL